MLSQRGNAIVFGVLIGVFILVGLGSGYYIWNQQTAKKPSLEKSNFPDSEKVQGNLGSEPFQKIASPSLEASGSAWLTYFNSADNYIVEYPQSIAGEKVYLNGPTKSFISNQESLPIPVGKIFRNIFIFVESNEKKLTAKEYVDQRISKEDALTNPVALANVKRQAITVGGELGEQVEGLPAANFRIDIFVPHEDKMYMFALDPSNTDNPEFDKEWQKAFTTILSTFKFTRSTLII